ncbi:MAG: hypothetical protein FJ148_12065 [Deltaproteobacteria bacterium]|nr:hypothetical protein [Deltaproteobacteria bacterium]
MPPDRTRRATSFGPNRAVAASSVGRQRHPRIAAFGRRVAVVWDDTRAGGHSAMYLAVSSDAGATFALPLKVGDAPAGGAAELDPDVAMSRDEIVVAWQALEHGGDDDAATIRVARFSHDGVKLAPDARVDGGTTPAGRWQPALALLSDGSPVVAWVDERDRGPDGVALERVYVSRPADGRDGDARAVRVDRAPPVPLSASLDNEWSPAILAVGDTVHVAWTDFRDYNWDVYAARSDDGGRTFGASQPRSTASRTSSASATPPLSHRAPAATSGSRGPTCARASPTATSTRRAAATAGAPGSPTGGSACRGDASTRTATARACSTRSRSRRPASAALRPGRTTARATRTSCSPRSTTPAVRRARRRQLFAALDDASGGVARREERVDDTGTGPSNQYRPHLAVAGVGSAARCVLVWEDDRDGRMQIYSAARACLPALPPPLAVR